MFSSKPSQEILRSVKGKKGKGVILDDGCNPAILTPYRKGTRREEYLGLKDIKDRNKETIKEEALRVASRQSSYGCDDHKWRNQSYQEGDDGMRSILMMMIPEHPYFTESSRQDLFIALVEVEQLQFALLGAEKQIGLMDSLTIHNVEQGETIYSRGEESGEFFIVLGPKNRNYGTYNNNSKPYIEIYETNNHPHEDSPHNTEKTKTFVYQDQVSYATPTTALYFIRHLLP